MQVLVDLAREVLVEQRLELAVLLLQLGDLGRGRARGRVRVRARARVRVRVRVRVLGLGLVATSSMVLLRAETRALYLSSALSRAFHTRKVLSEMMLDMRSQNSRSSRRVTLG